MNANKVFLAIGAKARLSQNPDVGSGKMSCRAHNGTSTTVDAKVTNPAETISESEARNSQ